MSYSVALIATQAEGKELLSDANDVKRDLQIKKLTLERSQDKYAESSVETITEITATQAELASVNMIVAGLPEGNSKEKQVIIQTELTLKLLRLKREVKNYGTVAMIKRERELVRVLADATEQDIFIAAIEEQLKSL